MLLAVDTVLADKSPTRCL